MCHLTRNDDFYVHAIYNIALLQTELSQIISPFEIRLKIRSINQWKCFNGWTMDHMRNTPNLVWKSSFDLSLGLAIKIRFVIVLCVAPVGFNTYQRTVYNCTVAVVSANGRQGWRPLTKLVVGTLTYGDVLPSQTKSSSSSLLLSPYFLETLHCR